MTDVVAQTQGQAPQQFNPHAELGSTGLRRWGGLVYEEFLQELHGPRGVQVFKEMADNDPICSAILFAIEMLVRNVEWNVEAASTMREDTEAKEFLESCLDDMQQPWSDTVAEILSMLRYGWSFHETVFKVRRGESPDELLASRFNDGRIGWRKLPIRSQDTLYQWRFNDSGEVIGFIQQPPPDYRLRDIPMTKGLLFRTTQHKGNPEGRSVLRGAYQPWYFKKHIERIEAIGIERDLTGLPVLEVPPRLLDENASAADKAALASYKKIARNLKRDEQEGVVWPLAYDENGKELYRLRLLATGGTRQFDTSGIVNRYDQRIAMQVLGDFILLGHEKVGSFALNSSKTSLFATAIGAWLESIADVFNRIAIPRLFRMNAFRVQKLPKLVPGDIESVDIGDLGAFIQQLSGAGAQLFPDNDLENWLRRQAKMPVREEHAGFADPRQAGLPGQPPMPGVPPVDEKTLGAAQIDLTTPETVLNGAQVTSLKAIVSDVAGRLIPRDSGVQMIVAAFNLKPEIAERIMGETGRSFFADQPQPGGPFGGVPNVNTQKPPFPPKNDDGPKPAPQPQPQPAPKPEAPKPQPTPKPEATPNGKEQEQKP